MNLRDKLKETKCGMKDIIHDLWITSDTPHIKEDGSRAYKVGMASGAGLQGAYIFASAILYFPAILPWFTIRTGTALNSIRTLGEIKNGIKNV